MIARKRRTRIVADTNVFVRGLRARARTNAHRRIIRLWLVENRLQLIVSAEIIAEYLEIFARVLSMDARTVERWRTHFEEDRRVTLVNLGRRFTASRDPDDNLMLAAAHVGRADYLLTNDRDLLDLPEIFQRRLPFRILTPQRFLKELQGA